MKQIVRQISPRKHYRLSKLGKTVVASRYIPEKSSFSVLYDSFIYQGLLYYREKTSENTFHLTAKKVWLEDVKIMQIVFYTA